MVGRFHASAAVAAGAVGMTLAIAILDRVVGHSLTVIPLFVLVPALAAIGPPSAIRPLWVSALTLIVASVAEHSNWAIRPLTMVTTLIGIATMGLVMSFMARLFARQNCTLDDLRVTSSTMRKMVQRPIPPRVGSLRAEVRYLSPPSDARLAGDLCDVVTAPFGVRLLIGDVTGRGITTVQTGTEVCAAFRDRAWNETDLSLVAVHLHSAVVRRRADEEFATVLLAQFRGATVTFVSCGHPAPLVVRDAQRAAAVPVEPALPLGLLQFGDSRIPSTTITLGDKDRLLMYTNGVTQARDAAGRPYPLEERVVSLSDADPEVFLDLLRADLVDHAGGRLADDAILLLVEGDQDLTSAAESPARVSMASRTTNVASPVRARNPHRSGHAVGDRMARARTLSGPAGHA